MTPDQGGRWGILGGLFDPVHNGHIQLAANVLAAESADGIIFVPSYDPPHKPSDTPAPFELRLQMLQLAIRTNSHFTVSEIERHLDGPGYTLHLIRTLKKRYPEAAFFFIIGADQLPDLPNWHRPTELAAEVSFAAGCRPGYSLRVPDGLNIDVRPIETALVDVSSTEIRRAIRSGADRADWEQQLPNGVADFIVEHGLYR